MADKNLRYTIGADYSQLARDMDAAGTLTYKWRRELTALEAKQREHRQTITDLGQGFATFGAVVGAGLGFAAKSAMDWESAWTGVKKTVDGSPEQLAQLEGELRKLATTLPTTHEEIAGVAEAAGQLGIKRADIAEFTKTMIDLGNTTNLTAEDAATELAKFSNIMGTSAKDVDRLGATLVALGNDGASTEADILEMGLRIAGAGKIAKLTEANVMSLASSLSSVGINAEAGGSSISRVISEIDTAARFGSDKLEGFAKVAGVTAQQFKDAYAKDASQGIAMFLEGLNKIQTTGGNTMAALSDLGYTEILVKDTLLRASSASDMFTKSLQTGSKAWTENTALIKEAEQRYQTGASAATIAWNKIQDAMISIGQTVGPVVAAVIDSVADLVTWWSNLPGPIKEVVTWVGLAVAGVTLFGGAALYAVPKIIAFRETMRTLEATGGKASSALSKFGLFLSGPWGVALTAGVSLLAVFGAQSGDAERQQQDLADAGKRVADAIKEQNGAINGNVISTTAKEAADKKLFEAARRIGVSSEDVTKAILNQGTSYEDLKAKLLGTVDANTSLFTGMDTSAASAQFLLDGIDGLRGGIGEQTQAQKDVATATAGATSATEKQTQATQQTAEAAQKAADALEKMIEAYNDLNGISLTYDEAQRKYVESLESVQATLKKNGKVLGDNTAAGRENGRALADLASTANDLAEAAAYEAQKYGDAAAGAAAYKNSLTASRPELIKQAIAFGYTADAAQALADRVLGMPKGAPIEITTPGSTTATAELIRVKNAVKDVPPTKEVNVGAITEEAQAKLREIGYKTRTLENGTVVVYGNTSPAFGALDSFVRTANNTTATVDLKAKYLPLPPTPNASTTYWPKKTGGVVAFAQGGLYERHVPQVAATSPGTARIWAEDPGAKWEGYVTEDPAYRQRSLGVMDWMAGEFGYAVVPKGALAMTYNAGASAGLAAGQAGPGTGGPMSLVATLVDVDGSIIARMRGVAQAALDGEAYSLRLSGGRV